MHPSSPSARPCRRVNLLFLITAALSATCAAQSGVPLAHFVDVLQAIEHGATIQSVANLNQCSPPANDRIRLGSAHFDHFVLSETEKDGKPMDVIGASTTLLSNQQGAFYLEHLRLRIFEDDSVELSRQLLNPPDYAIAWPGTAHLCRLNGEGRSGGGVSLFADRQFSGR